MKYRTLGHGLEVSAIGIGCMTMNAGSNIAYGDADDAESIRTVHRAIELGVTFFDTAEIYGPHINEEFLGRAIKGQRDKLVIATKMGFKIADGAIRGTDGTPENVKRACEGSLQRLGIDCIDLYYLHRVDKQVPIEDTVGAMAELKAEGKIRHIGLSEAAPDTIRRAAKVAPITALQSEYSIWERDLEDGILDTCGKLGIGVVPYSPLGRGFLAGDFSNLEELTANDWRRQDPRWQPGNFEANMKIVDTVRQIATGHGVSAAQIALAWLLTRGDHVVPIPGVKRRVTLEDSVAAAEVDLSAADLATIEAAAPHGGTAGPRYGERGMATVRA
jgi:aryl-alcohol dehydrogenase-like predicted oxidoreductase